MKNFIQKNPVISFIILIVVILIIGSIVHSSRQANLSEDATSSIDLNTTATSTDNASSSVPTISDVSVVTAPMAFSVTIATSSYSQNQVIPMKVSVLNLTDASTTLSFKNGCAGDYTIGDFDMIAHTTCTASSTSFIVAPHNIRQVSLVHYPSVYMIPVGNYTLRASIIGYGGNSVPITITQ